MAKLGFGKFLARKDANSNAQTAFMAGIRRPDDSCIGQHFTNLIAKHARLDSCVLLNA